MEDEEERLERSLDRLNAVMAEVMDLRHAASLMSWDEQVLMPRGAGAGRSLAAATVRKMAHEKFTSAEVGDLLAAERARLGRRDPSSEIGRLLAVTARDYEKATRVPATYVAEHAQVTSVARLVWQEARSRSDFTLFAPHLEKIIGLKRQYVSFFAPTAHPYDILLDDYEPGLTTHDVQVLFDALRSRQRDLIRRVAACPQIGDRLLHLAHPEQGLWDFGVDVATAFGFDWTRGRQDKSVHPFTGGSGPDDVRITTRFEPQQPLTAVFATMHETGHALYEQGVDPRWTRTALEGGASLGLHESQSRLWENLVGRSWPFWQHFWPKLQSLCHVTLHDVSLEEFYRTINRVQPSFIRVDADEATYNLHVMLRVEIEIAMLEETLSANDLPELWNAKMREYVGVEPPDARQGILQDMHWAIGLIGYFPTYTIGNVISAQLWETFLAVEPRRDELIQRGDFSALLAWLRRELHQHGRRFEPPDLLERITGRGIDPQPYLRYLEAKVGTVYQL
jgi:carboxypeptidase Taq